MPTPPTPNMGLILPTLGDDEGVWDDLLNAALGVGGTDDHDHSAGRGVKVKPSGIDINADLTFAGHRALNLAAAQLTAVDPATMAGFNRSLFVSNADNELYFRNNAGTNVKFTTGGTLNFSIVGGIGGDYTAVGALFSFDDGTDRYLAQQQGAPRPWAGLAVGNLDLYQQAASIVNRVRLKSPAALAASYDVTWLTALPGSTQILQLSAAGQMSASNTIANDVWMLAGLAVEGDVGIKGTLTTEAGRLADLRGTLAVGQTSTFTGVATFNAQPVFNAGALFGNNQNITLQGTGHVQHGDRLKGGPLLFNASAIITVAGAPANGSNWNGGLATAFSYIAMGVSGDAFIPIPVSLKNNERLKSVTLYFADNANANTSMGVYFGSAENLGGQLAIQATTGGGIVSAVTSMTCAISAPARPTYGLWVRLTTTGGSTGPKPYAWSITYDAT